MPHVEAWVCFFTPACVFVIRLQHKNVSSDASNTAAVKSLLTVMALLQQLRTILLEQVNAVRNANGERPASVSSLRTCCCSR